MRNDGTHFFRTAAEGGPEWDKHQSYDSYAGKERTPSVGRAVQLAEETHRLRVENAELHQEILRLRRLIADALELLKS